MYNLLFLAILILLIITYYLSGKDFMEPAVVLNGFFLVSILFSFYMYNSWKLYDYSPLCALIIFLGIFSFSFGWVIARNNRIRYKISVLPQNNYEILQTIEANRTALILAIIICFFSWILFMRTFRAATTSGSLASMISGYKSARINGESGESGLLNILLKFSGAIGICSTIVFLNNVIVEKNVRKNSKYLICPLLYLLTCFFSANRGDILIFIMNAFAAWYLLYHRIHGWQAYERKKIFSKGVRIFIYAIILFWALMLMTNNNRGNNTNFMVYICSYLSGSLSSFNMYIRQGGLPCEWFGQETFVVLNNNIYSLFGIGYASDRYLEFRSGFGYSTVNIYTSFRQFYHDFGMFGVMLLSFIQGYFTTRIYTVVKEEVNNNRLSFLLIFYCYFFYTTPYILINDLFFTVNVSLSGLAKIIILYISYRMFFYKQPKEEQLFLREYIK